MRSGSEIFAPPGSWTANGKSQHREAIGPSTIAHLHVTFGYHIMVKLTGSVIAGKLRLTFLFNVYDPLTNQMDN